MRKRWRRRKEWHPRRWTKVPESNKQAQTWNLRSADWTAEVMDVETFAEGITDPNRAAISAVIQVKDGNAWLELRSLVESAAGDVPRVTAEIMCKQCWSKRCSTRQGGSSEQRGFRPRHRRSSQRRW